jgi:alkaline phosphatase D
MKRGERIVTGNTQSATAMSRRGFISALTMAGTHAFMQMQPLSRAWAQGHKAPAVITSDKMRPGIPYGVASGDVTPHRPLP